MIECKNKDDLKNIEMILFSCHWDNNPHISPFYIKCNNEIFNYRVEKIYNKYVIITY